MTKIAWISDLHFERHSHLELFEYFDDADVLIIAGDLHVSAENVVMALKKIRAIISAVIVYVPGNHEYYSSTIKYEDSIFDMFRDNLMQKDIFILNPGKVSINGINFIGAPCWPDNSFHPISKYFFPQYNDFEYIKDFEYKHAELGKRDIEFISKSLTLEEPNIIVSHWLPLPSCISLRYISDRYNPCFANDFRKYIDKWSKVGYDIKLWVHGHSHDELDVEYNGIRYVRNPLGYSHESSSVNFNKHIII